MSSGSESEHLESEDYKSEEEEISYEFNAELEESDNNQTGQQSEHKGSHEKKVSTNQNSSLMILICSLLN